MSGPRRTIQQPRALRRRAAPFRWRLVVMVKVPVAGRVKTRLAREVGVATATRFARHAVAALLQRLSHHAAWQTTVAVAPDSGMGWRAWPCRVVRRPQGHGDLGARMQRIMDRMGPGPVVVIGTDVPRTTPAHIHAAFRLLGRHDAVFGPAADGGYWLVGLKRRPRVLRPFRAVRWSTSHALCDTLANLGGHSIARVATLSDVDSASDFALCAACLGRRVPGPA